MKKIAFSGTLDPITNGHMWVIQEARALADEVVVFISENPFKKPQFGAERRRAIVEDCVAAQGWTNVAVIVVKGDYTARAAKRHGIDYLIRGIRNTSDFDYENLIQQANVDVLQGAKTIFVMPPRDLGSVSSSFVRALQGPVGWHRSVRQFLPAPAYRAWILDWLARDWEALWQGAHATPEAAANAARWFAHLVGAASYGAPQRHYHTLDHLVHGLSEINVWAANTGASPRDVATLKQAYWFHDAVYATARADRSNEEESAQLWEGSGLDPDNAAEAAQLIRATDHLHAGARAHRLTAVMLGVDLAILGQAEETYDAYAQAVRMEYQHVPDEVFKPRRAAILRQFQAAAHAGTLYEDRYFSDLYCDAALRNVTRELARLAAGVPAR
jgi:pantetheine-phosphate adenylyltransferase